MELSELIKKDEPTKEAKLESQYSEYNKMIEEGEAL